MPYPPEALAAAGLVIFLGYTVFGITGFGSSITAMPLLAHLFPLRFAVPMMLFYDLASGLFVGAGNWRQIDRREIVRVVPYMFAGVVLGLTVLVGAPQRLLMVGLGASVLGHALYALVVRPRSAPIRPVWALPLGGLGGVFSALFGTGGPIYAIYLVRRIPDKSRLRASMSALISVNGLWRLAAFSAAGLYAQEGLLAAAALFAPCMLAGLFVGSRLHRRIPARHMIRLVWAILVVGGASLVVRGGSA